MSSTFLYARKPTDIIELAALEHEAKKQMAYHRAVRAGNNDAVLFITGEVGQENRTEALQKAYEHKQIKSYVEDRSLRDAIFNLVRRQYSSIDDHTITRLLSKMSTEQQAVLKSRLP